MSSPQELPLELIYLMVPPLWGGVLAVGLFGVIVVQGWIYTSNNRDDWPLRSLVAFVIGTDFAFSVLVWKALYFELIQNYGKPAAVLNIPRYVALQPTLLAAITFCVQIFFATRVYLLNRKELILPGIIVFTAVASLVGGILTTVDSWEHNMIEAFKSKRMKFEAGSFSIFSLICDIVATAAITKYLWKSKSAKSTRGLIIQILRRILTRGFLVTAAQLATVIIYLTRGHTLEWVVLWWSIGKVYIITMLAMLNARSSLKASVNASNTVSLSAMHTSNPLVVNIRSEIESHPEKGYHQHSSVRGSPEDSYEMELQPTRRETQVGQAV